MYLLFVSFYYRDATAYVAEIINTIGQASAAAQGQRFYSLLPSYTYWHIHCFRFEPSGYDGWSSAELWWTSCILDDWRQWKKVSYFFTHLCFGQKLLDEGSKKGSLTQLNILFNTTGHWENYTSHDTYIFLWF